RDMTYALGGRQAQIAILRGNTVAGVIADQRKGAAAPRIDHSHRRNRVRADAFPRTQATLKNARPVSPPRLTNRSKRVDSFFPALSNARHTAPAGRCGNHSAQALEWCSMNRSGS